MDKTYQIFFEQSFDLMAIVGTDGYFKKTNPAFERVLGFTEAELISKPLASFLHPADLAKTKSGIDMLAEGTARLGSINRYRCKDGSYRWFSWNTRPVGTNLYTIGRDITDQVQSEEKNLQLTIELERRNESLETKIQERLKELKEKDEQLQQLQKLDAVGRLAGGIAHDFNNILGAILMYSDLITRQISDSSQVTDCISQIEKATERGALLTKQLLIFSKKRITKLQPVQLNAVIQNHLKMLHRLIDENIQITFRLEEDLPIINADPGQLEQVVMNLVINARNAMPQGGRITIETRQEDLTEEFVKAHLSSKLGPHVVLTVVDTGCGMDEQTKRQIFDPFFTNQPMSQAAGLGLSTVYGIIKALEGTIWVYSEPDKGSVFKIYIPATKIELQAIKEPPEIKDFSGNEAILLVEDDLNLRNLYGAALSQHGYKIRLAENGKVALDIIKNESNIFDLFITDMIMPEMGGLDLIKEIYTQNPEAKVLCISGYPGEDSSLTFIEDHKIGQLQKPFNTATLARKIRSLLDGN